MGIFRDMFLQLSKHIVETCHKQKSKVEWNRSIQCWGDQLNCAASLTKSHCFVPSYLTFYNFKCSYYCNYFEFPVYLLFAIYYSVIMPMCNRTNGKRRRPIYISKYIFCQDEFFLCVCVCIHYIAEATVAAPQ